MKSLAGARVLSGTVLELAEFARSNGYKLQSNRRGYITFIPLDKQTPGENRHNNVVPLHQNQR